ncbi:MAG: cbb3-type cytochrome c oxidase subunit I [Thermomicrobiaceae bacterium]
MSSIAAAADQPIERSDVGIETAGQMWSVKGQLIISLASLAFGGFIGLFQALERIDVTLPPFGPFENYYQGLTFHGVLLAFVFTFGFANSFVSWTTIRGFNRPLASTMVAQGSFWVLLVGTVLGGATMLFNEASVLYTFYSPMQAHSLFYLGAALLVVSTWLVLLNIVLTYRAWRRENPTDPIPLLGFVSITTYIMWGIASTGVAVLVVGILLPWSLGILEYTDPQLGRTLFWFSGHAIVYFWLLPAYISWYMMIPKQVGGRLYSDGLTRFVFILFLLFSIPTGLHHQFTDPGIHENMKVIHLLLTFVIFYPSLITAFSIMAALENGGRRAGGKGLFGWILALPWNNPSVVAQLLAMLVFTLGGVTGLVNASLTVNMVVHNTAFIPGHFHLTVGTAAALTFIGVTYWFVPYLTKKPLFSVKLALWQAWLWAIGVLIFSRGQMSGGLETQPRRTMLGEASYSLPGWDLANWLTAAGGVIMTVSGLLFFIVMIGTLLNKRVDTARELDALEPPMPEAPVHDHRKSWKAFDRLGIWTIIAIVLVLAAYIPVLMMYLPADFSSPGIRVW